MELFDKRFEENENEDLAKNEPQMPIKGRVIAEKVALSTSVVETLNRKYIAFDVETHQPRIIGTKCVGCHLCRLVCPINAIGVTKRTIKKG